jgi:RNA-binding protein NOB1
MNPSQKYIVVDANAFIHCSQLRQLGIDATLCTTSSVLNELKDQKTKDLINSLPYELKVELPSAKAIKTIKEFARKTGDIVSLSEPDIEIIALAYDYCEKLGLLEKLNKEPKQFQ